MILEIIFEWIGGLFCISLAIFGLFYLWFYMIEQMYMTNFIVTFKSIYYHLIFEVMHKKKMNPIKDLELKEGTQWYTKFRNKRYLWKVIKVEEIKQKEVKR